MATITEANEIWDTTNTAADATKTVAATPASGDLIVVIHGQSGWASGEHQEITDNNSGGGGTYTRIGTATVPLAEGGGTAGALWISVRDALITSATSTTFTLTQRVGAQSGGGMTVLRVSGMSRAGSSAIKQSIGQNNQTANPASIVFGAAPLTTNPIILAVLGEDNPAGLTSPTGFTETTDTGWATPAAGIHVCFDNSGNTSATINYQAGGALTDHCDVGIELDASALPILAGQWDVNTRGRTDNSFREWVNGVTETLSGTTSLDTSGTYNGINFNGTTGYCRASLPAGLSTTFADSDYTIAARCKLDTVDPAAYQGFFGAFDSASDVTRVHLLTRTGDGVALGSHTPPTGTAFQGDGVTNVDDGAEHVVVQRRSGDTFSLWVNGIKTDEETVVTPGTVGTLNRVSFGVRDDLTPNWWFDGTVKWASIYNYAITDAQVVALSANENPYAAAIKDMIGTGIIPRAR